MLAAAQTPFGSPGRSASAEAAAKAALEAAKAATQTLEGGVEANEGGASQAAAGGAAMAVEVVAAPVAPAAPAAQALADYYYSTADKKEIDAIETICNSNSPINKAHAIYYFKNQEYFIDYCNEFVFLSNENNPAYSKEYKRLNDFLQREKFIAEIKEKDAGLIKETYNMLLCNIPSAKYDYYLYDCLQEIIDDKELFYRGPLADIFDDGLKKSHIFYYLQYIE